MRNTVWNAAVLAGAIALVGCGPATRNPNGGDDDTTGDANNNNNNGDGGNDLGCSAAAMLVYTVDQDNKLSTFNPANKTFSDIGTLNCPAGGGATPFSMGVDRTATAWVLYSNGELFQVNTTTVACTKTSWTAQNGLTQFGMGFSTDTTGGTSDTLFIGGGAAVDTGPSTLAKLDTTTFTATTVGTINGWPELTGTGTAELWGFFPDMTNPKVEKINKASGAAIQTFPESSLAGMPLAWAFAFWGGDYWIFLMKSDGIFPESATTVYQVDGMTGAIKSMTPTNTRTIVGAGVSTCAPVVIQ